MEKRVLYGLVVMLMYLVGSAVGQGGEVKLMNDEDEWRQILNETILPVLLSITSSWCGYRCDVVEAQVDRMAQNFGDKIELYTANILSIPSLAQLYSVVDVPTVIIFKDGIQILRYENLSDWGNLYNLVNASVLGSPLPPSGSGSGSSSLSPSPGRQ